MFDGHQAEEELEHGADMGGQSIFNQDACRSLKSKGPERLKHGMNGRQVEMDGAEGMEDRMEGGGRKEKP